MKKRSKIFIPCPVSLPPPLFSNHLEFLGMQVRDNAFQYIPCVYHDVSPASSFQLIEPTVFGFKPVSVTKMFYWIDAAMKYLWTLSALTVYPVVYGYVSTHQYSCRETKQVLWTPSLVIFLDFKSFQHSTRPPGRFNSTFIVFSKGEVIRHHHHASISDAFLSSYDQACIRLVFGEWPVFSFLL